MTIQIKTVVFLQQDTLDYLDQVAHAVGKKFDCQPTRSLAVQHLVRLHWMSNHKKQMEKKAKAQRLVV